jgi:hypothetical protein
MATNGTSSMGKLIHGKTQGSSSFCTLLSLPCTASPAALCTGSPGRVCVGIQGISRVRRALLAGKWSAAGWRASWFQIGQCAEDLQSISM